MKEANITNALGIDSGIDNVMLGLSEISEKEPTVYDICLVRVLIHAIKHTRESLDEETLVRASSFVDRIYSLFISKINVTYSNEIPLIRDLRRGEYALEREQKLSYLRA